MAMFEERSEQQEQQEQSVLSWPKPFEEPLEEGKLPEDWKERLDEMQSALAKMRDEAYEIPSRYQMSREEFEAYCSDSKNFSQEEWSMMCEAKEQANALIEEIEKLAPTIKKKKKRAPKQSRGWISVN